MNCIFICVFNNKRHIILLYLLLESLFVFGNLQQDTDILIYTSTEIMNIIKLSHLYNEKIKFETNDTYNDVDSACKSRIDLFALPSASKYNRFLYLDTDILVFTDYLNRDINSIFDLATEDILYVLEEGVIDASENYFGKSLFGDEIQNYTDKSAFSSGIMLFKNCEKMKFLFSEISECMRSRKHESNFYDQPFIIYNAFKYRLYDNQRLKPFAINQNTCFNGTYDVGKIINHFPGDPTAKQIHIKIEYMQKLFNIIKDKYISQIIEVTKKIINEHLLPIIRNIGEPLDGNIFMHHLTTEYNDAFLNKAKNISNLVINRNIRNIMEIGFNSGFSALLMLISNPNATVTCFDLGEHKYTLPCYQKIQEFFGDRIQLIVGDSTHTLQNFNNSLFDVIHIDGGHSTEVAESDIIHSYKLSKKGTIFIMDDYDFPNLHELWDKYIRVYDLKPLHINTYTSPHQDIKYIAR